MNVYIVTSYLRSTAIARHVCVSMMCVCVCVCVCVCEHGVYVQHVCACKGVCKCMCEHGVYVQHVCACKGVFNYQPSNSPLCCLILDSHAVES